jgi:UDP-N-acetylglucosamine 2-epimerase
MRETCEQPEDVEGGAVRLVGTCRERIVGDAARLLSDQAMRNDMARRACSGGDGRAAERIARVLLDEPALAEATTHGAWRANARRQLMTSSRAARRDVRRGPGH